MKSCFDFVNKLKFISPSNYIISLFDFKSLFTKVPIKGVWDCLKKRLREFHYSSFEIEEILNLVHLCVSQSAYVFNTDFYSQLVSQPLFSIVFFTPKMMA